MVRNGLPALSPASLCGLDYIAESALPPLALALPCLVAFELARRGRLRQCGLLIAWGLLLFCQVVLVPRGVFAVGWFVQPLIVLMVTCTFGMVPGLLQAVTVVLGLSIATWITSAEITPLADSHAGPVLQAVVASAVTVAMALCGVLLHRTLVLAIRTEEHQRLRMEEQRRALRHRENLLRHAMRIDTVGELSSMVVHQLRNQFQLILGYATIGMQAADPRATAGFRSIIETLGKSNDLLENLLGMARQNDGRVEPVDLCALCRQVADSYARVLPSRIALRLSVPTHPVSVLLDPQGLEHALLNLVINARQAIRGQGAIEIKLTATADKAVLEVSDTGPGIAPQHLESVFRPFFTTKEKGKGTGLGLAAVQRFARSSNGEVHVRSEPGQGAAFILEFPALRLEVLGPRREGDRAQGLG